LGREGKEYRKGASKRKMWGEGVKIKKEKEW